MSTVAIALSRRPQLHKTLIGPAGEHYVLFRLLQRGILAALAPPGAEKVDILVLSTDEQITATIQVKTSTTSLNKGWPMNAKHETIEHPRAFYAFVDLKRLPHAPVTYIVPSQWSLTFSGRVMSAGSPPLGKKADCTSTTPFGSLDRS